MNLRDRQQNKIYKARVERFPANDGCAAFRSFEPERRRHAKRFSSTQIRRKRARMDDGRDYYSILGLTPDVDQVVVRAAWKALLCRYHPDINPDPGAADRAQQINEAFAVIGRADRREVYDRLRRPPDAAPLSLRMSIARGARISPFPRQRADRPLKVFLTLIIAISAFSVSNLAKAGSDRVHDETDGDEPVAWINSSKPLGNSYVWRLVARLNASSPELVSPHKIPVTLHRAGKTERAGRPGVRDAGFPVQAVHRDEVVGESLERGALPSRGAEATLSR